MKSLPLHKVTKHQVFKDIVRQSFDDEWEGIVKVEDIVTRLNTSHYYAKKQMNRLVEDGYLVKGVQKGGLCEFSYVPSPPIKGYYLTKKAEEAEIYSLLKKEVGFECVNEYV